MLHSRSEDSLPQSNGQDDDFLDQAYVAREVLAEVIAVEKKQWQRERALIEAEAGRIIAEFKAEIVTMRSDLTAMVTRTVAELQTEFAARLRELRDGVDGKDGRDGQPGPPGEAGPAGPQGEKGDVGEQGLMGLPGPAGESGQKGDSGSVGSSGEKGEIGEQGPMGLPGPVGEPGQKGDLGPVGPPGEAGRVGLVGEKGEKGDVGPEGPHGQPGVAGDCGPAGPIGHKGDRGETGLAGPEGPPGLPGLVGKEGPPGEQGEKGDPGPIGLVGKDGQNGKDGKDGKDGSRGERGEKGGSGEQGRPGKLPIAKTYKAGAVHYEADVVVHEGSMWQAICDTASTPPSNDWIGLAYRGVDGADAVMPEVIGTYDATKAYFKMNIVALNGSSFVARKDKPGSCPGSDWQMIAVGGKQGIKGPPGAKGERGETGSQGPSVIGWKIDKESYTITPIMSDGEEAPVVNLRQLFEQFHSEALR